MPQSTPWLRIGAAGRHMRDADDDRLPATGATSQLGGSDPRRDRAPVSTAGSSTVITAPATNSLSASCRWPASSSRRYGGAREPFEDLLQVASLGLVKAVDRFDTSRGTAFSSFAVPTIMGEIKRYFRDQGWAVHVPRGAQERAVKVEDAQNRLSARTGHAPTVAELAEYLEFSLEDVLDALETSRAHHAASLDAPSDDGDAESGTVVDTIGAQ